LDIFGLLEFNLVFLGGCRSIYCEISFT